MAELTFAQIMERRQQEAHEHEKQAKAWAAEVTEQLANERSKFMEDFTENDRRIFGLITNTNE